MPAEHRHQPSDSLAHDGCMQELKSLQHQIAELQHQVRSAEQEASQGQSAAEHQQRQLDIMSTQHRQACAQAFPQTFSWCSQRVSRNLLYHGHFVCRQAVSQQLHGCSSSILTACRQTWPHCCLVSCSSQMCCGQRLHSTAPGN